jgi:drug/metabolite transporter (DMT)-like permease
MTWFFIALIGPLLYATTNYIDKFLLSKYFKEGGVGTILIFSSFLSAIALPFFFFADKTVLDVGFLEIIALCIVGILNTMVLLCYLLAIEEEEASVAVVFYQLIPVFGCILGYFVLGETLTKLQFLAITIIILGTTIISFEIDSENKFRLRRKTIIFMVSAAFFWALGSVIFKSVALQENLWRSLFWEHLMLMLIGIGIFTFMRPLRNNFLHALRSNSKKVLSLNVLNEFFFISGNIAVAFAYMLAPVGLVLLTESFQPIFVLAIGIFLTIFFPRISTEKIQAKHLLPKIIAICITGIGTYMLFIK